MQIPCSRTIAIAFSFGIGLLLAALFPDLRGGVASIAACVLLAPLAIVAPLAIACWFLNPRLRLSYALALAVIALAAHAAVALGFYAGRTGSWQFDEMTYTLLTLEWIIKLSVLIVLFAGTWMVARIRAKSDPA